MKTWETFIALDDDYATSKGLPHSQRWPWDHNKGVYIFSGAHELHCTVRRTLYLKAIMYHPANHATSVYSVHQPMKTTTASCRPIKLGLMDMSCTVSTYFGNQSFAMQTTRRCTSVE